MSNSVYQTIIDGGMVKNNAINATGAFDYMKFVLFNKYGLSMSVFVITLCISLVVEPDFLLVDNKDIIKQKQLGYIRTVILSGLLSALVLVIPMAAKK
jgi:hypothetical protein